ncbi:MAG: hypothetical protein E6J83_15965 [Deltaproteobacteria bacterium]|nr:MAG: hypothetical protein E6J83_15965 [Deltaproteobacteria bacterium]
MTRAHRMAETGHPEAAGAASLADVFARGARRRVQQLFREMWRNDDARRYGVAWQVFEGKHVWFEQGVMPLGFSAEDLQPPSVTELLQARRVRRASA